MTDTTYTVLDGGGEVHERHLDATDAAHEVLSWDGHLYEVRDEGNQVGDERQFAAHVSAFSVNGSCGAGRLSMAPDTLVYARDAAAAWPLIAAKVCALAGGKWDRGPSVVTDAQYDQEAAEAAEDAAEAEADA